MGGHERGQGPHVGLQALLPNLAQQPLRYAGAPNLLTGVQQGVVGGYERKHAPAFHLLHHLKRPLRLLPLLHTPLSSGHHPNSAPTTAHGEELRKRPPKDDPQWLSAQADVKLQSSERFLSLSQEDTLHLGNFTVTVRKQHVTGTRLHLRMPALDHQHEKLWRQHC